MRPHNQATNWSIIIKASLRPNPNKCVLATRNKNSHATCSCKLVEVLLSVFMHPNKHLTEKVHSKMNTTKFWWWDQPIQQLLLQLSFPWYVGHRTNKALDCSACQILTLHLCKDSGASKIFSACHIYIKCQTLHQWKITSNIYINTSSGDRFR